MRRRGRSTALRYAAGATDLKRRLFNFAAAASLVLCVAFLLAGTASYWFRFRARFKDANRTSYRLTLNAGLVDLGVEYSAVYPPGRTIFAKRDRPKAQEWIAETFWNRIGFYSTSGSWALSGSAPEERRPPAWFAVFGLERRTAVSWGSFTVPIWFPALVTVLLPCWRLAVAVHERRRSSVGRCRSCGYDLRATPDRCPECGAVPRPPHNPPMQRTATASSGAVE